MRSRFISSLALTLAMFVLISVAAAQELPDPGILPDSWMYGIKRAFESISLILTFDEVAKVEKRLQYAELRLIEAKVMAEKGKPEYVEKLLGDYQKELEEVSKVISSAKNKERLSELVALATSRHLEVLDSVIEVVPEEAKERVIFAKEMSIRGNQEALRALASLNPKRAAEIAMKVAEKRLNRVMHSAEKGDVEGITTAIDEYKQYASFGEEIASIAQQAGEDPTKVQEIVANATSIHLSVLRDTLQKVPVEAKDQIQSAIEVSKAGKESAEKALKENLPAKSKEMGVKVGVEVETPEPPVSGK
jgi:hypothetical protein